MYKDGKAPKNMGGIATVEMAMVAPLFLVMLFSIIEFGLVLYDKAIITNASLQLAQAGATMTTSSQVSPPSSTEIAMVVAAIKAPSSLASVIAAGLVSPGGSSQPTSDARVGAWDGLGYPLTVTVSYQYQSLVLTGIVNMIGGVGLPNPIPLSTTVSVYLN